MYIDSLRYFTRLVSVTLHRRRRGDGESVGAEGVWSRGEEIESRIARHGLKGESGRKGDSTNDTGKDEDEDEC
jgi:hypothetical protein